MDAVPFTLFIQLINYCVVVMSQDIIMQMRFLSTEFADIVCFPLCCIFMNLWTTNCEYDFGYNNFLWIFWHFWSLRLAALHKKSLKTGGWVGTYDIRQLEIQIIFFVAKLQWSYIKYLRFNNLYLLKSKINYNDV